MENNLELAILLGLGLLTLSGWMAFFILHRRRVETAQKLASEKLANRRLGNMLKQTEVSLEKEQQAHRDVLQWWEAVPEEARRRAVAEASRAKVLSRIQQAREEREAHDRSE